MKLVSWSLKAKLLKNFWVLWPNTAPLLFRHFLLARTNLRILLCLQLINFMVSKKCIFESRIHQRLFPKSKVLWQSNQKEFILEHILIGNQACSSNRVLSSLPWKCHQIKLKLVLTFMFPKILQRLCQSSLQYPLCQ